MGIKVDTRGFIKIIIDKGIEKVLGVKCTYLIDRIYAHTTMT